MLIDVHFSFSLGGHHNIWNSFLSYLFYTLSYKMDLTSNFSNLTFSLLCILLWIFYYSLVFEPNIGLMYQYLVFPGDGSGKEHSCQCRTYTKTQVWSLGEEHHWQEGTAAYSSILAWPIHWTQQPVGLQSVGLQRVGHKWSDLECMHAPIFNHLISCLLCVRANIFPYKVLYSYDFRLSLNPDTKKLSVRPR